MKLDKPSHIDRRKWLQALGMGKLSEKSDRLTEQEEQISDQLAEAEEVLLKAARPQAVYKITGLSEIPLAGSAIRKHLAECHSMVLMGATLGADVDRLIRMTQIRDMARAVMLDCGASVLIEQVCDRLQERMEQDIRQRGAGFLTGRYSPGYGDLPIETQKLLLTAIDGPRKAGLTATESSILIPRKSVTAILGVSDHPVKGYLATCAECVLREECKLRKEGKNCTHEFGLE